MLEVDGNADQDWEDMVVKLAIFEFSLRNLLVGLQIGFPVVLFVGFLRKNLGVLANQENRDEVQQFGSSRFYLVVLAFLGQLDDSRQDFANWDLNLSLG